MIVYKGRLLKKSSNRKSKLVLSTLVTTWLSNIAFHLQLIWLQTLVAIDSESRQTSFQSFCAQPSEVAVLFDWNLSRRPFLGQVAFHSQSILLQNLVVINSESCQTSFSSFCAPPSEVTMLFNSNLSRRPFLPWTGRRLRYAALHRIRFGTPSFVPMPYFYLETSE